MGDHQGLGHEVGRLRVQGYTMYMMSSLQLRRKPTLETHSFLYASCWASNSGVYRVEGLRFMV